MQFTQLFVIVAASLPAIMAATISCQDPKHACKTYNSFPDCSPEYVKTLEQCESTGCTQFFLDPLEHCACDSPLHVCSNYAVNKDCSPEYVAGLKECIASECINFFLDPLSHCAA